LPEAAEGQPDQSLGPVSPGLWRNLLVFKPISLPDQTRPRSRAPPGDIQDDLVELPSMFLPGGLESLIGFTLRQCRAAGAVQRSIP
jgi:hypothetical protein